jgi:hypothetical protein
VNDRLDRLLKALPPAGLDHNLDQLEPAVWARIDARRRGLALASGSLRLQLAAAALALVVGLALGWSAGQTNAPRDGQMAAYAGYAEVGPMARLEEGL